ncbi:MAG: histidinol-phosphate transaminase [Clostridiales Family XIII bacterium]|jgi:histidinol-phosphate aminotransferase|nr:histidinol-phosphate transaminase [Clostridiales Family XIII bacterium]
MEKMFRKELEKVRPYVQGKPIEKVAKEYGLKRIEKLASNENHFGISTRVENAIIKEIKNIHLYPDGSSINVKKEIEKNYKIKPENIVLGTGGEQLIFLLSMAVLNKGENIIMSKPSFDLYKMTANIMGAKAKEVSYKKNGQINVKGILDKVNKKTKIIYIASPNNPTGAIASEKEIKEIIKNIPEKTILFLDEAYFEFATVFKEYSHKTKEKLRWKKNICILRTFSKIYSIAGLRIGYIFTNKEIAKKLEAINLTFGKNRLAESAAIAALKDKQHLEKIKKENKKMLEKLEKYFDKKNMKYIKPYGNFIWVDIKRDSKKIFEELQKKGVIIRPGFLWGYDTYLRISTGTKEQINTFTKKFDEILEMEK